MASKCRNLGRNLLRGKNAVADGGKIARAAAADDDARQRALQIGHGLQILAQRGARRAIGDECRHGIEPVRNFGRIGERRGQPLRQCARARGGDGPVDGGEQRAAPFARERAREFKIGAGRRID